MRKKKGISPLIATVLILGFTVALAAIIMVWGQRFTTNMQKQTEETANTQIKCATDVDFKIKDACSAGGGGYKVTIENNQGLKIDKLVVRFYQAVDNMQATDMFNTTGVGAYGISSETYTPNPALQVKFVEAIPVVTIGGKPVTCAANRQDFGSLEGAVLDAC
ncbi:MAG: archaellin/type IV pilin N-terminal domain-containing protein [archaeon]